jgi:hypothetical protein
MPRTSAQTKAQASATNKIAYALTQVYEGSGIAYWAETKNVKRNQEGLVTSFQVRDEGNEGPRVSDRWTLIHYSSVTKGWLNFCRAQCLLGALWLPNL